MRIGKDFYTEVPIVKIIHHDARPDKEEKKAYRQWFREVEHTCTTMGNPEYYEIVFWNGDVIDVYSEYPSMMFSGGKYSNIIGQDAMDDIRRYLSGYRDTPTSLE